MNIISTDTEAQSKNFNGVYHKYNFGVSNGIVASFNNGDLTSNITLYPYVENANEIAATNYSGTVTFRVYLVEN